MLLFEALSRLHVDKLKSIIYQVNNAPNLEEVSGIWGCSIELSPTTYLGLALEGKFKYCEMWNGVIETLDKRLVSWQMHDLSMWRGRLTLIDSVLDSMSTYFRPLFPIPKQVEDELDGIRRNLLWEGNNSSHKFHLVKLDKFIQPKSRGGPGIRDLSMHNKCILMNVTFSKKNKCILMKWLWKYAATRSTLWKEVIKAKHGVLDNWCSKVANAPHWVGPWEYISKLGQKFSQNVHCNWCTYYILEK